MDDANGAVIETWKTLHVGSEMPRFRARDWIECGRRRHGNRRPPDSRSDLATLKPNPANPKARSTIDPGSGMVGTIGTVGLSRDCGRLLLS